MSKFGYVVVIFGGSIELLFDDVFVDLLVDYKDLVMEYLGNVDINI